MFIVRRTVCICHLEIRECGGANRRCRTVFGDGEGHCCGHGGVLGCDCGAVLVVQHGHAKDCKEEA
jgi:hypothetical protein